MNNFNLRELIQRIAWKRTIIIFIIIFILYLLCTQDFSCSIPSITIPTPSLSIQTFDPLHTIVVIAMVLIFLLGVVKLITRRRR